MSTELKIFHGGCLSCTSQRDTGGTARCWGCQYFQGNWKLPSLATNDASFHLGIYIREVKYQQEIYEKVMQRLITLGDFSTLQALRDHTGTMEEAPTTPIKVENLSAKIRFIRGGR